VQFSKGTWFTVARFAMYLGLLAVLAAHYLPQADDAKGRGTRFGATSQNRAAVVAFWGPRLAWVGVEWTARCSNGMTLGPIRTRYFPSDWHRAGRGIAGSRREAVELISALGTADEQITGSIAPGPAGQGHFTAVARFHAHGVTVVCRSGRVVWVVSDPA
jgi:hypothetical protein